MLNTSSARSQALTSLVRALEEVDMDTEEHVKRTQQMGIALGHKIGLSDAQLTSLQLLCLLHDIGKIKPCSREKQCRKFGIMRERSLILSRLRKRIIISSRYTTSSQNQIPLISAIRSGERMGRSSRSSATENATMTPQSRHSAVRS